MYIYIYNIHIFIYIHIYIHTHTHTYTDLHTNICMYVCMYVCTYVYIYIYIISYQLEAFSLKTLSTRGCSWSNSGLTVSLHGFARYKLRLGQGESILITDRSCKIFPGPEHKDGKTPVVCARWVELRHARPCKAAQACIEGTARAVEPQGKLQPLQLTRQTVLSACLDPRAPYCKA